MRNIGARHTKQRKRETKRKDVNDRYRETERDRETRTEKETVREEREKDGEHDTPLAIARPGRVL